MRDKGGKGAKNPKNLRDVIYGWSLMRLANYSVAGECELQRLAWR